MKKKNFLYFVALLALLILCIKYSDSILGFAGSLWGLVKPLALGCVIAYILNILVTRIERLPFFRKEGTLLYRIRRPVSILGSLTAILAIGTLVILIVIPQLVQAIGVIAKEIPAVVSEISVWLSSFDKDWPQLQKFLESLNVNWPQLLQKAAAYLTNGLSSVFSSTVYIVSTVSSMVITAVVALIFSIYILSGREKLLHQFRTLARTYLNEKIYKGMCVVLAAAHDTFTKFIVGQCTEAVILGTLCTIGMLIFRFPYATMVGTLIGATALLPVVGAYLGAAVGAFMIFTVAPLKAIGFLIFIAILQQLEGNLIYPRVVGSSVGLPGIWVLAAVTVGGGLGGIIGMLLAVPVTATFYKLLQKDVKKRKAALQPKKEEGLPH